MTTARPSAAVALILPTLALAGSVVVTVLGALSTNSATSTLNAALTSQTGTAADVYGSQSAIVVSSGLLTAGIVGIVVSLAVFGVLIGFGALSKPVAEAPIDEAEPADDEFVDAPVVAPAAASAVEPAAAPVAETPIAEAQVDEAPVVENAPAEASASTESAATADESPRA